MLITAEQKTTRQSPRKVRLVANAVRKLSLKQALDQLSVIERRSSVVVLKVLRQALANAMHNHGLSFDDLKLSNIIVNEGVTYKRWQAVSRGRGHSIMKRSSYVKVVLESTKDGVVSKKTAKKALKSTPVVETPVAVKQTAQQSDLKNVVKQPVMKQAVQRVAKNASTARRVSKGK